MDFLQIWIKPLVGTDTCLFPQKLGFAKRTRKFTFWIRYKLGKHWSVIINYGMHLNWHENFLFKIPLSIGRRSRNQ